MGHLKNGRAKIDARVTISKLAGRSHHQKGFSLVEVLVAMALISIISVAFVGAMGTAYKGMGVTDEQETAKNLAESQLEYLKNVTYANSYVAAPMPDSAAGYAADISVGSLTARDSNIQKITVSISHYDKSVLTMEGYKRR